ncbi:hypothetical protein CDD82_1379 [Ophiocordyceps australis]|uniref:Putative phospholipase n=1 Tax=Ophiocordyceps australis TaxID=1399860 RepID=A0A2C5YSC4_9HYPO|nr:hypothetical protein CDD82_1379 [Ophiocordyceps australis]
MATPKMTPDSDEELELASLASLDSQDAPDAPLAQPKWLQPTPSPSLTTTLLSSLSRRFWLSLLLLTSLSYLFIRRPALPAYNGPHAVGTADIELALDSPLNMSDIRLRSGPAVFTLETVLFTLYYPAAPGAESSLPQHEWLSRPISLRARGYARFAHVDFAPIRLVFTFALWALAGAVRIPAAVDVPLIPLEKEAQASSLRNTRLPVLVFSHGMASSRNDYTALFGQLASRGIVVAALEHRDGSCPGTVVKRANLPDLPVVHFAEKDLQTPDGRPIDTPTMKRTQLAFREAEMWQAVRTLRNLDAGLGAAIAANNTRKEGSLAFDQFKNRLDFDRLIMAGHSYGATGALQALDPNSPYSLSSASSPILSSISPSSHIKPAAGLVLDPGKESGPLNPHAASPLLVIHSNSWSRKHSMFYGRPHFDTVRDLVLEVLHRIPLHAAWFLTSIGTAHPTITDAPFLAPLLLRWATGATLDPHEALDQYVGVADEFVTYLTNKTMTGLLHEKVTHRDYGVWVSKEREKEFPEKWNKLWEVHVSPESDA